ncbi:MAG: hypothetical protein KGI54_09470 [Pseudomonadota bacterium]|nr:hypothetical protein [Pseudomonadota bacterium]
MDFAKDMSHVKHIVEEVEQVEKEFHLTPEIQQDFENLLEEWAEKHGVPKSVCEMLVTILVHLV